MKTITKPLSIRVIYWATNIAFWIYVASSSILVVIAFVLMSGFFGETQLEVGVPSAINVVEQGTLELNETLINIEFSEMYGKIHFIDAPAFIGQIYSIFILIITALVFYIFLIFRKFINNVYKGIYFKLSNIALLKKISYALVGIWIFIVFYAYFQHFYLVKNIHFDSIEAAGDVRTYPIILLFALFIWVLSHIFMKGCELQEDHNHTI